VDPSVRDNFLSDLCLAQKTVSEGVCSGRARSSITHWDKWLDFCDHMGLHPFLEAFDDKVSILQVFLQRVRIGELAASGDKIRARSAEDYVRSVAQTFLSVGADDPRLNSAGKIDFRLQRMIAAWKRKDPPSKRVKPIPVQVLRRIAYVASHLDESSETLKGTADMIFLAFFYLLRPGEYTDAPSDTVPFTFNKSCPGPGADSPALDCLTLARQRCERRIDKFFCLGECYCSQASAMGTENAATMDKS
jgi:hypothetical protein